MITHELSNKIKIAGLLCTIMVVYRHSMNLHAFGLEEQHSLCTNIETAVSKLTEIAVPYFFIISGFFFFGKTYCTFHAYSGMLKKKARSLFIPLIFWNLIGLFILSLTNQTNTSDHWYEFPVNLFMSEWNGVLWYVRDLLTMMILVPIYGWIFKCDKWWLYAPCFIILFYLWVPVSCNWVAYESMLFFFIGGIMAQRPQFIYYRIPLSTLLISAIVWGISSCCFPYAWNIHKYNTILGICVFWSAINHIPSQSIDYMLKYTSYSFFIYVTHLYMLKAMKMSLAHVFYQNEFVALTSYLLLPLICIVISIGVGIIIKQYIPKLYYFATGGRA